MSHKDDYPVKANGRTIGYVQYRSAQGGHWIWVDDTGASNGRSYGHPEAAGTALADAYWAAVEEFGRDAHASAARI